MTTDSSELARHHREAARHHHEAGNHCEQAAEAYDRGDQQGGQQHAGEAQQHAEEAKRHMGDDVHLAVTTPRTLRAETRSADRTVDATDDGSTARRDRWARLRSELLSDDKMMPGVPRWMAPAGTAVSVIVIALLLAGMLGVPYRATRPPEGYEQPRAHYNTKNSTRFMGATAGEVAASVSRAVYPTALVRISASRGMSAVGPFYYMEVWSTVDSSSEAASKRLLAALPLRIRSAERVRRHTQHAARVQARYYLQ